MEGFVMKDSTAIGLGIIGVIGSIVAIDTLVIKKKNALQDEASFLSNLKATVEHEPYEKGTKVTEIVESIVKGSPIYNIKVDVVSLDQTWANIRTPHFNIVITKDLSASEKNDKCDVFRLDF